MAIPDDVIKKMKDLTKRSKVAGRVLPVSRAFEMYPVKDEVHKGKIEYWTDPEGWERGDYCDEV